MRNFTCFIVVFFVCSIPSFAAIEDKTFEPDVYVVCKFNKLVRTIRVQKDNSGCETTYTKEGVDRIIGFGRNRNSCKPFLDNVKANLESANWSCRSAKSAKITASAENKELNE